MLTRELDLKKQLDEDFNTTVIEIDESNVPKTTSNSSAKILKFIAENFKNPLKHPTEVLLPTAIEGAIGFAFATADTPFLTKETTWYYHPFTITSMMMLLNFFSRSIKQDEPSIKNYFNFNRDIRSFFFGIMDLMNRAVLMHEAGHTFGALSVYRNPDPKITLTPPLNGLTIFNSQNLSELGMKIGANASRVVTVSAGVGTEMLYNVASLIAAQTISENYPEIKAHLRFATVMSVLQSAFYALSGAWDCEKPAHDFCYLKDNAGISPFAAAFFILGTMALLQLCLSCTTACCNKNKNENENGNHARIEEIPDNALAFDKNMNEEINETTKLIR